MGDADPTGGEGSVSRSPGVRRRRKHRERVVRRGGYGMHVGEVGCGEGGSVGFHVAVQRQGHVSGGGGGGYGCSEVVTATGGDTRHPPVGGWGCQFGGQWTAHVRELL